MASRSTRGSRPVPGAFDYLLEGVVPPTVPPPRREGPQPIHINITVGCPQRPPEPVKRGVPILRLLLVGSLLAGLLGGCGVLFSSDADDACIAAKRASLDVVPCELSTVGKRLAERYDIPGNRAHLLAPENPEQHAALHRPQPPLHLGPSYWARERFQPLGEWQGQGIRSWAQDGTGYTQIYDGHGGITQCQSVANGDGSVSTNCSEE